MKCKKFHLLWDLCAQSLALCNLIQNLLLCIKYLSVTCKMYLKVATDSQNNPKSNVLLCYDMNHVYLNRIQYWQVFDLNRILHGDATTGRSTPARRTTTTPPSSARAVAKAGASSTAASSSAPGTSLAGLGGVVVSSNVGQAMLFTHVQSEFNLKLLVCKRNLAACATSTGRFR